jgi:acetoin:2,6-dichlorophenolindophenol oxidoreductase subunit beta
MTKVNYRQALNRALRDSLADDQDVFLCGEDIGAAGGVFKITDGLQELFGAHRVLDTPISEQAIVGLAIGAAVRGLRPVAELMFADFVGVAFDQLAKYRYMTGGQVTLPVTIRLAGGIVGGFGAQHSQTTENWLLNVPGLKIAVPATPADAYGLLRSAIADDDPVLVFEHKGLLGTRGELPARPEPVRLGKATVVRPGQHVTVVASQLMLRRSVQAAEQLAGDGISAEVIDPRTLAPLDADTIGESVARTHHLVVVEEAPKAGSWGATLVAVIAERWFGALAAAPALVAAADTPIPYAPVLEQSWAPTVERIVAQIRATVGG